jgi:hypothetical protein
MLRNTALLAAAPVYPADFPIADRSPYTIAVDMGVIRSQMAAGNTRQRRAYRTMPHALALAFHMRVEHLFAWQQWINEFAYSWISMPVSTMYAGEPPTDSSIRREILRFTGDLAIAMDGWDWVSVSVTAELSPDANASAPPVGLGGWIVAGTPEAAGPEGWVIAGTPGTPSEQWVIAGTPDLPSAWITGEENA